MVTLDYKLSTAWNPHELDLRAADEMTLRYDAFQGDVVFRVDDADFSAQWGWVPVLDFAMAMTKIADGLRHHDRELFEFTESGATIHFQRDDGALMISASYAGFHARLPLFEFSTAADDFLDRVKRELEMAHPALGGNELFAAIS